MGNNSTLSDLLRSLCHNTQWKYAIFWKLDEWNQMQLYWEDAYFENTKLSNILQNGILGGKSGFISFGSESAYSSECLIRSAATNMASHIYLLGQGIVGNVASKKKHQWIFADEYDSMLLPECNEDCQQQFAAGIKTILLVSVIPLGVIQLGSLHKVMEDPMVVAQIKDLFNILQHTTENLDSYAPINMPLMEDLSTSSTLSNLLDPIHTPTSATKDSTTLDFNQLPRNELSNFSYQFQSERPLSQEFLDMGVFTEDKAHKAIYRETSLSILNQSVYPYHTVEGGSSTFVDELNVFSSMTPIEPVVPNVFVDGQEHYDAEGMESLINETCLDFPFHSELHKALGFGILEEYDDHKWGNSFCHTEDGKTSGTFIEKSDTEQLLDAIIANLNYSSDDDVSDISRCIRSSSNSSENFPGSSLTLGFEDSLPSKHQARVSLPRSNVSCLTNEEQNTNDMEVGYDRKGSKPSPRSKKRGRSSEARRPRDRQLIQDRLKELRELIPNGSKCSIDVLLERTVKHMSYLQTIPSRAEKLRKLTYPKIKVDDHHTTGNEVHKNGASWAYEVGGEPQVCPLIVENLDQPGQMLVEMLCKEYGLFLEIVQVIKCLKLTILKGVLENRSNELWAHFIIEGSRGFYRMDILLPLMQLLQRKQLSGELGGIPDLSMMKQYGLEGPAIGG